MSEKTKIQYADDLWKLYPGRLEAPLRWNRKPFVCDNCGLVQPLDDCGYSPAKCIKCKSGVHRRRVFVMSLGDFFDRNVWIQIFANALDVLRRCENLDFLVLTKQPGNCCARLDETAELWGAHHALALEKFRPGDAVNQLWCEREAWLSNWTGGHAVPANIWIGTSVTDQRTADERIPKLLEIPAKVRFISAEPLLTSIDLERTCTDGIHWIIAGCDSNGKRAGRNQDGYAEHARYLLEQSNRNGASFFNKQMPVNGKVSNDMEEWPADLRVREWPSIVSRAISVIEMKKLSSQADIEAGPTKKVSEGSGQ